ncbi:MAG TPA: superoxide dismutase [Cyclobacteriaceae bacterium]|nr:superoxide dismutase [Cyclobacteriaceae bacterium]
MEPGGINTNNMENISRRKFVALTAALPFAATAGNLSIFKAPALEFSQVKLPYAYNALEPHIDATTMEIHYTKHHTAYVKNANDAIAAEKITFATEKEFFANASKLSAKARNNGGGVWNHNFFWEVMKPNGGTPTGKISEAINGAFGSFDKFKEQFGAAATSRFGSGWAWLVNDGGKLKIGSTPNQDNPLMDSSEIKGTPLLGLDVWEHAYYLKYQNKRADYIAAFWNIINWDDVAKRL